jgi:hypothetical protein
MIEAPGWISSEVAGRSVVRSSRRVRIAGSGFGACFRSFGFEFQGPCSPFTSWRARKRDPKTLSLAAHVQGRRRIAATRSALGDEAAQLRRPSEP